MTVVTHAAPRAGVLAPDASSLVSSRLGWRQDALRRAQTCTSPLIHVSIYLYACTLSIWGRIAVDALSQVKHQEEGLPRDWHWRGSRLMSESLGEGHIKDQAPTCPHNRCKPVAIIAMQL
ncbi:hypothetical protein B0H67DRAFT_5476 [Lasiosphaeris hirsuta]|uniref:Uncharacterized protein n=1 Tax=Lasiosphaeris hirsuta TaxID=260670 RepID=A0AA40EBV9_9PEZI|nr:hypothetical protein B0H67DRAFT_5476 [Lasiosphaeris hirsuta]